MLYVPSPMLFAPSAAFYSPSLGRHVFWPIATPSSGDLSVVSGVSILSKAAGSVTFAPASSMSKHCSPRSVVPSIGGGVKHDSSMASELHSSRHLLRYFIGWVAILLLIGTIRLGFLFFT